MRIFTLPHGTTDEVVHRRCKEEYEDILSATLIVEEEREECHIDDP